MALSMCPHSTVEPSSSRCAPTRGKSTFPKFLAASWQAGVIRYELDFAARTVSYYGSDGEEYVEEYSGIEVAPFERV